MFNINIEKKSHKMSFKALPIKIQWSNNRQGREENMLRLKVASKESLRNKKTLKI